MLVVSIDRPINTCTHTPPPLSLDSTFKYLAFLPRDTIAQIYPIPFLFFPKLQLAKLQILAFTGKRQFLHNPRRATRKIQLSLAQKREICSAVLFNEKAFTWSPYSPILERQRVGILTEHQRKGQFFLSLLTLNEYKSFFDQCWNFRTIYGGQEPSMNRVVVRRTNSLESIPGLLKRF